MAKNSKNNRLGFRNLLITSIIGALTFVTGLFWSDAVRATIEILIPQQQALLAKWAAALAVTAIVVAVSVILYKTRDMLKQ
jgi:nucleoside recognition membrane protein YjiH